MDQDTLWQPDPAHVTLLTQFSETVARKYQTAIGDYADLHQWSVDHPTAFWSEVFDQCGAVGMLGAPTLENAEDMPNARFFPQATLNYAENCLQTIGPAPALIFRSETGAEQTVSWDQLHDRVSQAQQGLRAVGVKKGDRVVAVIPNCPAAVIYMLATASLGAIWSSCSPDFGAGAVIDRFAQIEPKVLIHTDGYTYKGKPHQTSDKIDEIKAGIPSLLRIVALPFLDQKGPVDPFADDFTPEPIHFERVSFNDPLCIMFSSGTSGRPKCIVHRSGGVLLQHLKEHQLNCDLRAGDRLFYYSTCSWMMWNWLVSGLASGAAIVLYDGSPTFPQTDTLWRMAVDVGVTHFGVSAKYIDGLRKAEVRIKDSFKLPDLRMILSTGSPLSARNFRFVYDALTTHAQLASISGGTDILSCFLLGCPNQPVRAGELQCAGLGMDVAVMNDAGKTVMQTGIGELTCRHPFPSQPLGFWNDPAHSKFRETYFAKHQGLWSQNDRVERCSSGGYIVLGRSDSVLNPGGVRIGTAEIYRAIEDVTAVSEAVAVGFEANDDMEVLLFVSLGADHVLDDLLRMGLINAIRSRCTLRHVPSRIIQVQDFPRTRTGKISDSAVRNQVNGRSVPNFAQLENPECLNEFLVL